LRLNWELTALESRCRTFPSALGLQKTTSFQEKWELKILTAAAEGAGGTRRIAEQLGQTRKLKFA
jgi:hypothetical protein